ncbi:MAG: peptidoglycan DD-metalloendopeptidase family protein [Candidatus Paceibacterota bacterium]|jgi:murein DD-endopeptidase MepM/ murein hydrolase activator NlpD
MKFLNKSHNSIQAVSRHTNSWTAIFAIIITSLLLSFGTAYAGLFSFLAPIIEGTTASAKIVSPLNDSNAQTMVLLQAATNFDPNPNKPANMAPIANNTLIPDIAMNNSNESDQTSTEINTYIVREGDTVSEIAKMFHVSINTILWANDLTSKSTLKAGQTLVILPVSGIMYIVKRGDTISEIAKKYGADEDDIVAYNDLSVSTITIGQNIIIPNAELGAPQNVAASSKKGTVTGKLLDNVTKLPTYAGYYISPLSVGRVSQGLHGHNGVDFAAAVGTPIRASAAGTVIISRINGGWNGGYGNFVVVSHPNGTQSLYAHMQTNLVVAAGDTVKQGELIGYIGMTGLTTGPHVHFEIRGAKNPF